MMTVQEFVQNKSLVEEYGKLIRSNVWAALMDLAKTKFMRPPDPRLEPVNFGNVDPNHAAPILYGIALGKWEVIDLLTSLHKVEDLSKMAEPQETFGAEGILERQREQNGETAKKGKVKNGTAVKGS